MNYFRISKLEGISRMNALHSHEHFEMYFQIEGDRSYFRDNKFYKLTHNTLVVDAPNVLHKYEGGPYTRILLGFDNDYLSPYQIDYLYQLSQEEILQFSPSDMDNILKILNEMMQIDSSSYKNRNLQLSLSLGSLLHTIYNIKEYKHIKPLILTAITHLHNEQIMPIVLQIMDYIKTNYNKKISLTELSNKYSISKTWICKCFQKFNNITVFQYKTLCQINEAKILLKKSYSIKKIAHWVGFSSSQHFSKVFKSLNGCTPTRWKTKKDFS